MLRVCFACLAVVSILAFAATPSLSQSEKTFGMGVDVENQSFELIGFGTTGSPFFTLAHTSLTPCFQLTFRAAPNLFIEPSFGLHRDRQEETFTGGTTDVTSTFTQRDVKVGLGIMALMSPDDFVSPYVRGKVDFHFLNAKEETDVTFPSTGTEEIEASATAIVVSGSLGGIINIQDNVFISLEGRLMYGRIGDTDESRSGPGTTGFTDNTDTEATRWATDMIIGLRVLFF